MRTIKLYFLALMACASAACQRLTSPDAVVLGNILVTTTPDGSDTKLADAAIGRYTLVKAGSDEDHVAVCTSADIPLGATEDNEAAAAEARISFQYFGANSNTRQGTASGAIAVGDFLVAADDGKVKKLPVAGGTYYIIGRAVVAAADGKRVHYVPSFPVQRVVT